MAAEQAQDVAMRALRDMRSARRRRFVEQLDVMEVLYRVYVVLIFGALGLALLAGVMNDADVSPRAVEELTRDGPALLGLGIALAVSAGLRLGVRGGPLAVEAAEVQYVLLAPIDRGAALRASALRQMRVAALAGGVFGAAIGNFAFRRLPGAPLEWLACLALVGAVIPVSVLAAAYLASGRQLRPWSAAAVGAALLAWTAADIALGLTTSPATMLGVLATLPLQSGGYASLAAVGVALTAGLACAGLLGLSGLSLEAARRRATLVAQLRFSASVQDFRAVVLLRRQLASENPRRRPWVELGAPPPGPFPVWWRGWRSFLRWPLVRLARVLLAGVAAGAFAAGAWSGTTPLVALAGLSLFVAALDLVEPLAQETDHPTRRDLLPVESASLIRRHLVAPTAGMGIVVLVGFLTTVALGSSGATLGTGAVLIVPTAFVLLCCAAISATNDPYAYLFLPEMGYVQSFAPIAIAIGAVSVPLVIAKEAAHRNESAVAAAVSVEITMVIAAAAMAWWLGWRVAKRTPVRP